MKAESPRVLDPTLQAHLDRLTRQLNLASDGSISGVNNATTAVPTTGTFARGDFVRNSAPAEVAGTVPTYDQIGTATSISAYVIFGWVCVTAGTPGTWKQCRFLTGS